MKSNFLNPSMSYICDIVLMYNSKYTRITDPNIDIIKTTIKKVKEQIKMLQSIQPEKYDNTLSNITLQDRISCEIEYLMSLQTYLIINFGIDML